jgi:hypothetical protein
VLPTAVKRVQFYSRNSHEKYVYWLIDSVDIPYNEELFKTNSRNVVDAMVLKMINEGKTITEETVFEPIAREIEDTPVETIIEKIEEEEPSWVEAARGAISEVVEDVVEEIQEKVEEVVEVVENAIEDTVGIVIERPVKNNTKDDEEMMIVPEVDNPFGGEIDYNSFTVRELQKECKARGITIRGTKSEVVLRLRHDDAGIVEQPTQGVTEAHSQESADVTPDAPSQEAATEEVTTDDDSRQTELTGEEE